MSKKQASTIGMMEGAFFVGRAELLSWINQWLKLDLDKVEQCANGAVYCQIIDSVYPGKVQMKKVNWMGRSDHEFIPNYKLLQLAFDRLAIERHIDVDKLIRAKYQDNLEFLQWMKCFFDKTYGGHDYNPIERRPQDAASLPAWAHASPHLDGPSSLAVENAPRPRSVDKSGAAAPAPKKATAMRNRQQPPAARGAGAAAANSNYTKMQDELNDLRITVEGLENERDYYFGKLREIEILTQTLEIQR
eukprot:GEMP01041866.1.p1 GENE.GEMP01041866.1~~GEMP01041866.1.p1  ORF type:complete len:247 (+),score=51.14 GEMP01041866.1:123-863(+)